MTAKSSHRKIKLAAKRTCFRKPVYKIDNICLERCVIIEVTRNNLHNINMVLPWIDFDSCSPAASNHLFSQSQSDARFLVAPHQSASQDLQRLQCSRSGPPLPPIDIHPADLTSRHYKPQPNAQLRRFACPERFFA